MTPKLVVHTTNMERNPKVKNAIINHDIPQGPKTGENSTSQ
jgi:hypothetical protein